MKFEETPWPPDYTAFNNAKLGRLRWLKTNPTRTMAVYNHYKPKGRDADQWAAACINFIEDWCVTYDPRRKGAKKIPFILFKRQKEFVLFIMECLLDKESGLVEKSRDIGASWLCCAIATWLWLYVPNASNGFGSLLQTKVDRVGDMDSLFEKIRFIIRNLPAVFVPYNFRERFNATFMKILNPENGSIIKGEGGDNIGRGGRSMIYFKDESAHYERPEKIEASLGDNTDVQIDISSVNGSNNIFYRRRMAGEVWYPDTPIPTGKTRVFIFDWREHPGKSQEWYDRRRQRALDEGLLHVFAQEVDRDYAGSVDRLIIPAEWARACIDAHVKLADWGDWYEGSTRAAQDLADEGNDKNALAIVKGVVLTHANDWGGASGDAAHVAIPECVQHGVTELYYDGIGIGSGFKVETNTMKKQPSWPRGLKIYPWMAGDSPTDPTGHIIGSCKGFDGKVIPADKESPLNGDFYANLKAQAWFRLRTRAYKTFQAVTQGVKHHPSEMMSIDSKIAKTLQICMELAQAVHDYSTNGKTMVDKKPDGARSPNLADAIVMAYTPVRPAKGFFDV